MKVVVQRQALLQALNVIGAVVGGRIIKPVLGCVKVVATGEKIVLSATDLEVAIQYTETQCVVEDEGETLIPVDKFREIVKESVDANLDISVVGEHVHIKGVDSHFRVYTQKVSDFPPIQEFPIDMDVQVSGEAFGKMVSQTSFAISDDVVAPAFVSSGTMLATIDGSIRAVACARHLIAIATQPAISVTKPIDQRPIVPAKAIRVAKESAGDGEVGIKITQNQAFFSTAKAMIATVLFEGNFPPYEQIIPQTHQRSITAKSADLLYAVRRAMMLVGEQSHGLKFSFTANTLTLYGNDAARGDSTIRFNCALEGEPIDIGFNPRYVADAIKAADTPDVRLEMTEWNKPAILRGGDHYFSIISPVDIS